MFNNQLCESELGGGFKYFLFSPLKLGKWSNLTIAYFSDGWGKTTNQRIILRFDEIVEYTNPLVKSFIATEIPRVWHLGPPKGSVLEGKSPEKIRGNLGWWNIISNLARWDEKSPFCTTMWGTLIFCLQKLKASLGSPGASCTSMWLLPTAGQGGEIGDDGLC